jgi:hypothetical protein
LVINWVRIRNQKKCFKSMRIHNPGRKYWFAESVLPPRGWEAVLVFTGWLGSGKSHAARLLAAAFPVQANVHTLGLYVKLIFRF